MGRLFIDRGALAIGGVAMTVGVLASDLGLFAVGCFTLIVATLPWPPVAR